MKELLYVEKETIVYTGHKRVKETRVAAIQDDSGNIKISRIFIRFYTQRESHNNHHPNKVSIA